MGEGFVMLASNRVLLYYYMDEVRNKQFLIEEERANVDEFILLQKRSFNINLQILFRNFLDHGKKTKYPASFVVFSQ